MEIKPRKVKIKKFNVFYCGRNEYAICAGTKVSVWGDKKLKWYSLSFDKHNRKRSYDIDNWYRWIVGSSSNSTVSDLKQGIRKEAEAAYFEMKRLEDKRLMLEELGIIIPPDNIKI